MHIREQIHISNGISSLTTAIIKSVSDLITRFLDVIKDRKLDNAIALTMCIIFVALSGILGCWINKRSDPRRSDEKVSNMTNQIFQKSAHSTTTRYSKPKVQNRRRHQKLI
jgi:hypothetical protein